MAGNHPEREEGTGKSKLSHVYSGSVTLETLPQHILHVLLVGDNNNKPMERMNEEIRLGHRPAAAAPFTSIQFCPAYSTASQRVDLSYTGLRDHSMVDVITDLV
jgi:hypothetical protein